MSNDSSAQRKCDVEICDRFRHKTQLYCKAHLRRLREVGDVLADKPFLQSSQNCAVEDCDKPSRTRGWCQNHYSRWKRNGHPVLRPARVVVSCSIDNCDRPSASRTWCEMHYNRWLKRTKAGRPINGLATWTPPSIEEKFWMRVVPTDGCWVWQGMLISSGYGAVPVSGDRIVLAHRVSYEIHNGPFDPTAHICHTCDNPPCVNPKHLFLGDAAINAADKVSKNRQPKGVEIASHVLIPDNVVWIREQWSKSPRPTLESMALKFGVDPMTIKAVVVGKTWKHLL